MKILTVCERGNSRSVALAWILKDHMNLNAIAMGIRAADEETKEMLYKWADKIILVAGDFKDEIPEEFRGKLKVWDVGPDRFFRGFEPELLQTYADFINKDGV